MTISPFARALRAGVSTRSSLVGILGAASMLVFAQAPSAKALPETGPAIGFNKPPATGMLMAGPYVLGYHFTTDFDRKLLRLGIYNSADDHSVGIWNFTDPISPQLVWSKDFLKTDSCESTTYFCWFDISNGPHLDKDVDYVAATTWGDELSPVAVPKQDVDVLIKGFKLNTTAYTRQGFVPDLLVDLNNPDYAPTEYSVLLEKGFITLNMSFQTSTNPPSQVPSPLPLLGATAAFGWSRKIRSRIRRASSR